MKIFISGIGTDVGKTVVSAILANAFGADYWKPVQTGNPDTIYFESLVSNTEKTKIFPAVYSFKMPASPHVAARAEHQVIDHLAFKMPHTSNHLIVEGAGGLLVPLNDHFLMADLIRQLNLPVILVSRHYLGSINHTLLSIEYLRNKNIPLLGLIVNGDPNPGTENAITSFGKTSILARINQEPEMNSTIIQRYATEFSRNEMLRAIFS
jgi:dethiobiotin synthetase